MNNNNDFILLPLWYQLFVRELLALRATQSLQGRNNAVIRLNGFITALVATGTLTATRVLVVVALAVGVLMAVAHLVAIVASRRLR